MNLVQSQFPTNKVFVRLHLKYNEGFYMFISLKIWTRYLYGFITIWFLLFDQIEDFRLKYMYMYSRYLLSKRIFNFKTNTVKVNIKLSSWHVTNANLKKQNSCKNTATKQHKYYVFLKFCISFSNTWINLVNSLRQTCGNLLLVQFEKEDRQTEMLRHKQDRGSDGPTSTASIHLQYQ